MDEVKLLSDDSYYTEDHVLFLLSKYRSLILKQRYSDLKKQVPESNYQTLCLDLIQVPAISGDDCLGGTYLRSKNKIPFVLQLGNKRVYAEDYFSGEFCFISRDRMRYVGFDKYLQTIIYCSIAPDNYLYFKSANPQFINIEKVKFTGIFQDDIMASNLDCYNVDCDIMNREFPLESSLIPVIIDLTVKELFGSKNIQKDGSNNASDDILQKTNTDGRK